MAALLLKVEDHPKLGWIPFQPATVWVKNLERDWSDSERMCRRLSHPDYLEDPEDYSDKTIR
jgi:hypothetical protein